MMQYGKINQPVTGFEAQRQILTLMLRSKWWELPFNWDFGRDPNAIDPVEQIKGTIEKYLDFTVDAVEIQDDRVSVWLLSKRIDVSVPVRP